ncbi:MAG: glycosyltransferase family 2 protein [Oscillochloris sp.]|nr:glycosyltransferase family 2 protein [Oscillochloris sp.]
MVSTSIVAAESLCRAPEHVAPSVSVVVVSYNSSDYLAPCLTALLADASPEIEIIVFDNQSSDSSQELVEDRFPQVRLVRSSRNLGFGEGNNAAVARARGDYLAFLNPDTIVSPGWLVPLVAALEADPKAGLATARIVLHDRTDLLNTAGNSVHISGLTLCRGMGRPVAAYPAGEVAAVSGAAFIMRRSLFMALGGFDSAFFMYMEDTDLTWRARLAGYSCRYVPDAVVAHHYQLRFGPRKIYYQERNRYLMLLKSLRWPTLVALLPALFLAEALTWGFVLLRDRPNSANKLKAYGWVGRHWFEIMAMRGHTQRLRRVPDRDLLAVCEGHIDFEQLGGGPALRLASTVCNPLFRVTRAFALAVVRW